ncbi:MAG TPA: hypothetical protein VK203_11065 [Nostocaceae cyanobacterium]|nr:hypothetical protein [Nostocaceae cyanobacterium]
MKNILSSGLGLTVGGMVALSVQSADAQTICTQQTETGNNQQVEIAETNNPNSQEYRDNVTQATWEILNQSNYKEILAKYGIAEKDFIVRSSTFVTTAEVKANLTTKNREPRSLTNIETTTKEGFTENEKVQQATLEILSQSDYSEILKKYGIAEEEFVIKSFLVTSPEVKANLIAKNIQAPDFIVPSAVTDNNSNFAGCVCCYFNEFGDVVCVSCPCPC